MRTRQSAVIGTAIFLMTLSAAVPTMAQQATARQSVAEIHQTALNACAEVVVADFEAAYPQAKRLIWNLSRLTAEPSLFGDQLKGVGDYRGKGGKPRTLEFDCTFDPFSGEVVKAVWESSHDPGVVRQVVDVTDDMEALPGKVVEACKEAIEERIREGWPNYREQEFDDQSLERRKTREGYLLRGEGRFMGGAGNWHRFDFRCIFDGTDVELRWKQYGKEVDE